MLMCSQIIAALASSPPEETLPPVEPPLRKRSRRKRQLDLAHSHSLRQCWFWTQMPTLRP